MSEFNIRPGSLVRIVGRFDKQSFMSKFNGMVGMLLSTATEERWHEILIDDSVVPFHSCEFEIYHE